MADKIIKCQNCGQDFAFTQDEQNYFKSKGLSEPKHCMICRSLVKTAQQDQFRGKVKFGKKE